MTDARPHLVAIDGQAAETRTAATIPTPGSGRPAGVNRAAWLAGAVALFCAIGWGMQSREGRALEQELARTVASLEASQARIGALEAQRLQLRERAEDLAGRTGGLVDGMGALLGQMGSLGRDLGVLGELLASDPQDGPATGLESGLGSQGGPGSETVGSTSVDPPAAP